MKKTTLSKKGFTLTEIVVVVAIIVIISAAAFVGVAVTLKRANDSRTLLNEQKGDQFELAARESIRNLTGNAADYVEAEYYEPDDDDEPVNGGGGEGEGGEGEGEGEGEGGGGSGGSGGSGGDVGGGGGGTPVTNTPTPVPATATPTPTTAPSGGHNAAGSSVTYVDDNNNYWGSSFHFNTSITTCIVVSDGSDFSIETSGRYNLTSLGGGRYQIDWQADGWGVPKLSDVKFHSSGASNVYVESFS